MIFGGSFEGAHTFSRLSQFARNSRANPRHSVNVTFWAFLFWLDAVPTEESRSANPKHKPVAVYRDRVADDGVPVQVIALVRRVMNEMPGF